MNEPTHHQIANYLIDHAQSELVKYVIEDTGCTIEQAMERVYNSPLMPLLQDEEGELYVQSPAYLYELMKNWSIHLHQRGRSKRVTELTHHQKAAAIWEIFFKLWCQRSNNKNNHQFVNALSSFYRYCMEKHEMIHIGQCFYMIIF